MTTDRPKETEEELLRSRELLDAVLDHAPGFIMAVDETGALLFINRVLPQHDKRDVIGKHWIQYMPPDQQDSLRIWFRAVLETGAAQTYETSVPGPTGDNVWLTSHMSPMRREGRVVGAVIVAQEITELRRTQLEVAATRRMAAVGTLAAGIAHEINTPVQFVGDSLHFVHEGMHDVLSVMNRLQEVRSLATQSPSAAMSAALTAVADAEAAADLPYLIANLPQAVDRCVDGLARVASIVSSIREFAHPARPEMTPADLNRAIENTLNIARNEYAGVADLRTDFGELPPITCHVDQVNQVVLNVVLNAVQSMGDVMKATGRKGRLGVRTRIDGSDVVVSISDTGTGIPEAGRDRVFEQFFTTKAVGEGTGQGLAIAWTLITEKHGGTLTFETSVGQGTTFFIRIPSGGKSEPVLASA